MLSQFSRLLATGMGRRFCSLCLAVGLALLGGLAYAGEAAHIVFVAGQVHAGARVLAIGDAVLEGDEIVTGSQGYVYLKTIDNGLLILRPNSHARIVTYHVDSQNPANTHIKFELLSGVARSVSGDAVKLARQNFRFNTPVAAIGVRGTDFTVSTDQETSRVTVISGAIVVSGFSGACLPGGGGPCDLNTSRVLAATQVGQMLQVRRGQAVPQLMSGGALAPDAVAPPRSDEPAGKSAPAGSPPSGDVSLDPQKGDNLLHQAEAALQTQDAKTDPAPPVVVVAPANPVNVVTAPASVIVWGRWQPVADQAPNLDTVKVLQAGAQEIGRNEYYAVFRTAGTTWQSPAQGSVGFSLQQSDASLVNVTTNVMTPATLQNGQLQVDFGKSSFSTSFDLLAGSEKFSLQAQGGVTSDGLLLGNSQYARPTNMAVTGVLSTENGGAASYIFSAPVDSTRVANGVTYWLKSK